MTKLLLGRLETLLQLLGSLLGVVHLDAGILLSLIRTVAQALTIAHIDLLHLKAVGKQLIRFLQKN